VTCVPTFAIIAGSRAIVACAGKSFDLPVHRDLAEDLLDKRIPSDFDIACSEGASSRFSPS
jgi:hypothetical protein